MKFPPASTLSATLVIYIFLFTKMVSVHLCDKESTVRRRNQLTPSSQPAQFNLRDRYLPYKTVIADITLTKNPMIQTVINKTETVSESHASHNPFRTLDYEILTGPPNLDVELKEAGCTFRFDFGRVFWNSRLQADHTRMVELFEPGSAVCDVMAGVGPFAVPAGKKGVFVWANDLNPYCFEGLEDAVGLNKVGGFVKSFCEDGHEFIKSAARRLLDGGHTAKVPVKMSRTEAVQRRKETSPSRANGAPSPLLRTVHAPKTFDHFVMNLPASAIDFLPSFIGIYADHEDLFETKESAVKTQDPPASTSTTTDSTTTPQKRRLPIIHCYCFGTKGQGDSQTNSHDPSVSTNSHTETIENSSTNTNIDTLRSNDSSATPDQTHIAQQISTQLHTQVHPNDPDVNIRQVRLVAPNKWEYCASFRLPGEVAFRKVGGDRAAG